MKGFVVAALLASAVAAPACSASFDEGQIRQMLKDWAHGIHDHDLAGVMMMYDPHGAFEAFDVTPPLSFVGYDAYRKNYKEFMAQFKGPIVVQFHGLQVVTEGKMGYAVALERISGTMTNGQSTAIWVRATSIFRKIHGHWYDVHDHTSVPADLDSGKAALDLTP